MTAGAPELVADELDLLRRLLPLAGLSFVLAGADAIPFPDASVDIALMFKSLHHVPAARLDAALAEIARVLAPGGLLYVSALVFAGPFNEAMRLFHDEEAVRRRFEAHGVPGGARFLRPMRVNLMRRPAP